MPKYTFIWDYYSERYQPVHLRLGAWHTHTYPIFRTHSSFIFQNRIRLGSTFDPQTRKVVCKFAITTQTGTHSQTSNANFNPNTVVYRGGNCGTRYFLESKGGSKYKDICVRPILFKFNIHVFLEAGYYFVSLDCSRCYLG